MFNSQAEEVNEERINEIDDLQEGPTENEIQIQSGDIKEIGEDEDESDEQIEYHGSREIQMPNNSSHQV